MEKLRWFWLRHSINPISIPGYIATILHCLAWQTDGFLSWLWQLEINYKAYYMMYYTCIQTYMHIPLDFFRPPPSPCFVAAGFPKCELKAKQFLPNLTRNELDLIYSCVEKFLWKHRHWFISPFIWQQCRGMKTPSLASWFNLAWHCSLLACTIRLFLQESKLIVLCWLT